MVTLIEATEPRPLGQTERHPGTDRALRQEVGPPRAEESGYRAPGRSAAHHPFVVALCTMFGILVGAGVAGVTAPSYGATATLIVGQGIDLTNTAAVPGLAAAAQQFAANYSRLSSTSDFKDNLAKEVGRPQNSLGGTVSASPIAQSNFVVVEAHASSQAWAVKLATAGQAALITSTNSVNTANAATVKGLKQQYDQAALTYEQAAQQVTVLQAQMQALQTQITSANQQIVTLRGQLAVAQGRGDWSGTQTLQALVTALQNEIPNLQAQVPQLQSRLIAASSSTDSAKLQVSALQQQYANDFSPVLTAAEVLQATGPASPTGSNRKATLEIALLLGLVAGLILGVVIASVLDTRQTLERRS